MKKEQFFFLLGGFAFGILVGYGLFDTLGRQPELVDRNNPTEQAIVQPSGPRAPGTGPPPSGGAGGGAPMVAQINALKQRLQDNPQDFEAAATLGGLYYRIGQWESALEFFEIAIGIRPDDPNVLTDSGNAHRQLGRPKEALDRFRQAHESDPSNWESLFNTAIVLAFDLGEVELAEMAMAKLQTLEPLPPQVTELRAALDQLKAEIAATTTE